MTSPFSNRKHAGILLAAHLLKYAKLNNMLILALPRGGVPIGYEIAKALHVPLDIFLVRKLGMPGHEELAMGAIALGDVIILNEDIIRAMHITDTAIQPVFEKEKAELARRNVLYRNDRPTPAIKNKIIILVDDGIATGATMRATIAAIKSLQPEKIIVAVPVAAWTTYCQLANEVDEIICLETPEQLYSIGAWYRDFSQVEDEEVLQLLAMPTVETKDI